MTTITPIDHVLGRLFRGTFRAVLCVFVQPRSVNLKADF